MDNTDFDLTWRKRVLKDVVTYALRELRETMCGSGGEDLEAAALRVACFKAIERTRPITGHRDTETPS